MKHDHTCWHEDRFETQFWWSPACQQPCSHITFLTPAPQRITATAAPVLIVTRFMHDDDDWLGQLVQNVQVLHLPYSSCFIRSSLFSRSHRCTLTVLAPATSKAMTTTLRSCNGTCIKRWHDVQSDTVAQTQTLRSLLDVLTWNQISKPCSFDQSAGLRDATPSQPSWHVRYKAQCAMTP